MLLPLSHIPLHDRPREKARRVGVSALSDRELLGLILGRGHRGMDVMQMADRVLLAIDRAGFIPPPVESLRSIPGLGEARKALILAALEFARRRIRPRGQRIARARDAFDLVRHYGDRMQEHFLCISLNGASEVLGTRVVSVGLLNRTQVHPREVFSDPIRERAGSIVVAHNHPSGNVEPGRDDIETTQRLKEAGEILGIPLLDHIIFSSTNFFSLQEHLLL